MPEATSTAASQSPKGRSDPATFTPLADPTECPVSAVKIKGTHRMIPISRRKCRTVVIATSAPASSASPMLSINPPGTAAKNAVDRSSPPVR